MLELSGVNVHYSKIHVLRDVTLRVETGEVAALIGPNAAGKTTTLRALVGLKDCTSGVIRFGTQPIQRLPTPDRIRLGIALVPEGRQVFPKFSVIENLRMGASSEGRPNVGGRAANARHRPRPDGQATPPAP
jgi:branched-chain amino acid transport system ATP-binding protein